MTKDDKLLKDCFASLTFKMVKHKFCSKEMPQRAPRRKLKPKPASQHWKRIK